MDKEKAEAYDKLLVKAKQIYNKENDVLIIHTLEDLFPELKESEDEKIRKHLISLVKNWDKDGIASKYTSDPNDIKQILAWLKKQDKPIDEEKVLIGARKDIALSIMDFLDKNTLGMCLSNMECEDLEDAVVNSDWSKVYNYMKKKLEKQGEKPIDNVKPKFKVGDWIVNNISKDVFLIKSVNSGYCTLEDTKGNIYSPCLPFESDFHLWTIDDAKDGDILADRFGKANIIILYKGINPKLSVLAYCGWNGYNLSIKTNGLGYGNLDNTNYVPATKEQRDTLMKAMTDAGWEFNFEKKELEKIVDKKQIKKNLQDNSFRRMFEQKSTERDAEKKELKKIEDEKYNGEDYGIDGLWHAINILERTLGKVSGYQTDDGFLSHQCAITSVKKLYKKKPVEWSEEDERIYQSIIDDTVQENQLDSKQIDWFKSIKSRVQPKQEWSEEDKVRIEQICDDLECGLENFRSRKNVKGLHFEEIIKSNIDWLKSLKDRYNWKPSKEQMDALNNARWNAPFSIEILDSLYNDLKKLTE